METLAYPINIRTPLYYTVVLIPDYFRNGSIVEMWDLDFGMVFDLRQQRFFHFVSREVFRVDDIIELAPVKDMKSMRGSLPGLNTEVDRAERDRV